MVVESQIILKYDPEHERFLDQVEIVSTSRKTVCINDEKFTQKYTAITNVDLDEQNIRDKVKENEDRAVIGNDKKIEALEHLSYLAVSEGWTIAVQIITDC